MVPGEVTLIPNFVTIRHVPLLGGNDLFGAGGSGLYDTYAANQPITRLWQT
jgi:multiple sugar transport system permease protein